MKASSDFPYCHPQIASILALERTESNVSYLSREGERLAINFPVSSTTNDLIGFAIECEKAVFRSNSNLAIQRDSFLQSLIDYSCSSSQKNNSRTAIATLLALNFLESSIRYSTGHYTGRAPLLKTMISEIPDAELRTLAQLLLLPTGLNLRNLLWHGFVPDLPRHWLAAVVVLARALHDGDFVSVDCIVDDLDLSTVTGLKPVISYDIDMATTTQAVLRWLPNSHHPLWHQAMEWYQARIKPVSTMTILAVLLEHGLRLSWCNLNERQDDIAVPSEYYVTLDGFGQRQQHNILMHPYFLDEQQESRRNRLMDHLPGSTTALITDLFCSPCGPNIRSKVAHGSYDALLFQEWQSKSDICPSTTNQWQMTHAVLVGIYLVASRDQIDYRPMFSFAAVSEERIEGAQDKIQELCQLSKKCNQLFPALGGVLDDTNTIDIVPESFNVTRLVPLSTSFSTENIFSEYEANVKLANAGAARMLLQDVEMAAVNHIRELKEAIQVLEGCDSDKRKEKRTRRVIESTQAAYSLYRFGMCVAFLHLKDQLTEADDKQVKESLSIRTVERLRMVISTFDNFLHSNTERAMKALREYNKAKKTKVIADAVARSICKQSTDH